MDLRNRIQVLILTLSTHIILTNRCFISVQILLQKYERIRFLEGNAEAGGNESLFVGEQL